MNNEICSDPDLIDGLIQDRYHMLQYIFGTHQPIFMIFSIAYTWKHPIKRYKIDKFV